MVFLLIQMWWSVLPVEPFSRYILWIPKVLYEMHVGLLLIHKLYHLRSHTAYSLVLWHAFLLRSFLCILWSFPGFLLKYEQMEEYKRSLLNELLQVRYVPSLLVQMRVFRHWSHLLHIPSHDLRNGRSGLGGLVLHQRLLSYILPCFRHHRQLPFHVHQERRKVLPSLDIRSFLRSLMLLLLLLPFLIPALESLIYPSFHGTDHGLLQGQWQMEMFQESSPHFSQVRQQYSVVSVHQTERSLLMVFLYYKYLIHLPLLMVRNTIYRMYRNL